MNRDGPSPPADLGGTAPRANPTAIRGASPNAELLMMAHLEASPSACAVALVLDGSERVVAARVVRGTDWSQDQIAALFEARTLVFRPLIDCEPELLDFDRDEAAPGRWAGVVQRAKRLGVRSMRITPVRTVGQVIGAVLLFADEPAAFEPSSRTVKLENPPKVPVQPASKRDSTASSERDRSRRGRSDPRGLPFAHDSDNAILGDGAASALHGGVRRSATPAPWP